VTSLGIHFLEAGLLSFRKYYCFGIGLSPRYDVSMISALTINLGKQSTMNNISIQDARYHHLENIHRLNQDNLPHVGSVGFPDMVYLYKEAIYFRIAVIKEDIAGCTHCFRSKSRI
jgi:hypothetical protein